ncbi:type II toxin-antitoxin system Phd/YefM family antitoxin [Chloroflexi bacterium TSY]|nr:type II toxin-antitoxin system Phd/YefM family antitoxin [Chloroflexi bacterium TSY]
MQTLMQTASSGDVKQNPNSIFDMAQNGPVRILSRSTTKAVVVSPFMWDAIARRLAYLESLIEDDLASRRIEAGEYDTVADVDAMMARS